MDESRYESSYVHNSNSKLSGSLLKAADQMEGTFRTMNNEITALEQRLEANVTSRIGEEFAVDHLSNVSQVRKRLHMVNSQFVEIKNDLSSLRAAQEDAVAAFRAEFEKLSSSLSNLQHKVLPDKDFDETASAEEQTLMNSLKVTKDHSVHT